MNQSKIVKKYNYLVLISLLACFSACKSNQTYTLTKVGSDQILNGSVQKEILLDQKKFPWFNYQYNAYKPDSSTLAKLARESKNIYVLVFAGSWCSDTQQELPRFYKICDLAGIPKANIGLMMLDQDKKCSYMNVASMQIKNVPTFIFYREGIEIGRIIEKPKTSMEADIYELYQPN